MRDTNTIGSVTEGHVLSALLSAGYVIAIPFGIARYDLIVEVDDNLKRVQCKTGRLRNGSILFNMYSVRKGNIYERLSYRGQVDYFGVYCPDTDKVYLVPADDEHMRNAVLSLRVESKVQRSGLWAKDYEIKPL